MWDFWHSIERGWFVVQSWWGGSSKRIVWTMQQELHNKNNSMWWRQCRNKLYYIMKISYKFSATCRLTIFGSQAWVQNMCYETFGLKQECEPTLDLLTLGLFFYVIMIISTCSITLIYMIKKDLCRSKMKHTVDK